VIGFARDKRQLARRIFWYQGRSDDMLQSRQYLGQSGRVKYSFRIRCVRKGYRLMDKDSYQAKSICRKQGHWLASPGES
jgi:hypothetical protein